MPQIVSPGPNGSSQKVTGLVLRQILRTIKTHILILLKSPLLHFLETQASKPPKPLLQSLNINLTRKTIKNFVPKRFQSFSVIMDGELLIDDDGTRRLHTSGSGKMSLCEVEKYQEPYEDMVFESEEAARAYYDDYAGRTGFVTRVLSSRKSERDGSIISRGLGCRGSNNHNLENVASQKRGRRKEGCTAMILVKREKPGRWVVRKFVRDHNHPLVDSMPKRRPTFDEKDKRIQELTAELRVKKRLNAAYREQLFSIMKDVESHNEHLSTKVQVVRNNLKELEARRQELVNHK